MRQRQAWRDQFPLRARGRHLVNRHGERFKLAGVNWYGASDSIHVVGGLDLHSLEGICEAVAQIGFTVVRLPFSNEMLRTDRVPDGVINYALNPGLRGLTPLEVYDRTVDALGDAGVAVVLNNHTTIAMWSGGAEANGLWYLEGDAEFTEANWILDWLMLAERYRDRPHVIGYDLRNEVRPTTAIMGSGPDWGSGGEKDWGRAAGKCAKALMVAHNGTLPGIIIVERICWPQNSLQDMLQPVPIWESWGVPRDRMMLALHMYAWSGPDSWSPKCFTGTMLWALFHARDYITSRSLYGELDDNALDEQMDREWGFCLNQDICPVWLSEFGCCLNNQNEFRWFEAMCRYLERMDADFSYWPLNVGQKPGGGNEGYGILTNDWRPRWGDARLQALRRLAPSCTRHRQKLPRMPSPRNQVGSRARAVEVESGSESEDVEEAVPSLAAYPRCLPLPGPLAPWPDEKGPRHLGRRLPAPRYLWHAYHGRDADPGQNARVESGSTAVLKHICVREGYGGFAHAGDIGYMREGSGEEVSKRLENSDPRTTLLIADEIRYCAVWDAAHAVPHDDAPKKNAKDRDLQAAMNAATKIVEVKGSFDAVLDTCQQSCLRRGYSGFEIHHGNPAWGKLWNTPAESAGHEPSCASSCTVIVRGQADSPREADTAEVSDSTPQTYLLEHALVRIGLEAFPGMDAFSHDNARILKGANLTACKQLCLEEGLGGFAVYQGDAYFRTAQGSCLRRNAKAGFPDTTLYVLTAHEVRPRDYPAAGGADSRAEVVAALLPRLWRLSMRTHAASYPQAKLEDSQDPNTTLIDDSRHPSFP